MNANQYRAALERMGLTQVKAAELLGIDPRTSRRYALGECPVPEPIMKLLLFMEKGKAGPTKGRPVRK
jgi:transcriptional regulator with XRE-family HTH domain